MQFPRDKAGYLSDETIAAIATQVGGAISIVRMSGKRAFPLLQKLTRSDLAFSSEPSKLFRTPLYLENGKLLDDSLCVRFVNPSSYTGEDLVEFHLHGSNYIALRLLETLGSYGARQALPGEFSFRAVKNGKMTLFQAQAVADLIAASNDGALCLALEKIGGAQNKILEKLSSEIKRMAALGEIGIDFSDQDVDEVSLPRLKEQLSPLIDLLEKLRSGFSRGIRLQEGIQIAFVGLPNAGKSSFFNAILGEDRSIVSEIPGTTRDVVHEKLTLRGKNVTLTFRLEDTAGLRLTEDSIEKQGMTRTYGSVEKSDLVLLIVDPRSPLAMIQEQWTKLSSTAPIGSKTIGILTHLDCLGDKENAAAKLLVQQMQSHLGITRWKPISSKTGEGISEAIDFIVEHCEQFTLRDEGEVLLTRMDHLDAVSSAIGHLKRALIAPEVDLFASDMRQTYHSLGPIIGEILPDDILGEIFSHFCIGK